MSKREPEISQMVDFFYNHRSSVLHLNWFLDAYWTKVTKEQFLPGLLAVYNKLVEKKISEKKPMYWGDADGKLYYIPNDERKVFVFTTQSQDYLFVLTPMTGIEYFPDAEEGKHFGEEFETHSLHIRRIWRKFDKEHYAFDKDRLKDVKAVLDNVESLAEFCDDHSQYPQRPSLEMYRKINFDLDNFHDKPRFYGDIRDSGYILSMNDRYGMVGVEGTKYSHNELEMLSTVNLGVMFHDLDIDPLNPKKKDE